MLQDVLRREFHVRHICQYTMHLLLIQLLLNCWSRQGACDGCAL
jgi:hypothetical protein